MSPRRMLPLLQPKLLLENHTRTRKDAFTMEVCLSVMSSSQQLILSILGGWYWCALDVPNEAASTPPANPPETAKVAVRELENNEKRCFHNGGPYSFY